MKIGWEQIEDDTASYISRAKVLGGWLIKCVNDVTTYSPEGYGDGYTFRREDHGQIVSSITFMPDSKHEWK